MAVQDVELPDLFECNRLKGADREIDDLFPRTGGAEEIFSLVAGTKQSKMCSVQCQLLNLSAYSSLVLSLILDPA
jgi:hypothetical protein